MRGVTKKQFRIVEGGESNYTIKALNTKTKDVKDGRSFNGTNTN